MAKITFPAVSTAGKPSRWFISEVRQTLRNWADWARKSPKEVPSFLAQITAFLGVATPTAAVVVNGQARAIPVTGTYATTATFTVANGAVTAIVLS